jgi:hypothetical protein
VTVTSPDGTAAGYTVTSVATDVETAAAAAAVGRVVVVAETAPGRWTVLAAA